jgi:hypothetical protein
LDELRRITREFAEDKRRLAGELERTRVALDAMRRSYPSGGPNPLASDVS